MKIRTSRVATATPLSMESLESRRLLAVEYRMLAVVYPNAEFNGQPVTVSPETLKSVVKQIEVDFPALVNQIAGDQIQLRTHVEVVNRVVPARGDGLIDEPTADPETRNLIGSGWYDHYMIVGGDANGWRGAGCGYLYPNIMSTLVAVPRNDPYANSTPLFLHEWMHALERFHFSDPRVGHIKNPQGGDLGIHDTQMFGYTDNVEGRYAWTQWYRDFLTDNIKNLHTDGSNTGFGLGPDAWAIGTIRAGATLQPGSPLDRPDVNSQSLSWLSDVTWGWGTSGDVRRNASADFSSMRLDGTSFTKGIGTVSGKSVVVNLSGRADRFQATIGLNDSVPSTSGSVYFEVYGDDNLIYRSGKVTGSTPSQKIDLNVLGIRQLRLVVNDAGDGSAGDIAMWANARVTPFYGKFVSDIDWGSSSTGWASLQLDHNTGFRPITINNAVYGKGVGAHANSSIAIPLDGKYDRFTSFVGIDDLMTTAGSSEFMVYGDGNLLFRSGVRTYLDDPMLVDVSIKGVKELRLVATDAGDSGFCDHSVWGNAYLTPSDTVVFNASQGSTTAPTAQAGAVKIVKQGAGTLVLDKANSHSGGTIVHSGEVIVRNIAALGNGTLEVMPDATVTIDVGSVNQNNWTNFVAISKLVLHPGARMEIGTGQIRVNGGNYDLAAIRSALSSGRNGGAWNGSAGFTSASAGLGASRAIGYRVMPSTNELRLGFVALGDTNLDGLINSTDITFINNAGRYGQGVSTATTWADGDFNYDGRVTSTDITLLNNAGLFGKGSYLPVAPSSLSATTTDTGTISADLWAAYALTTESKTVTKKR